MDQRCDACKHWKATDYDDGVCNKIMEKLTISIITGSEGAIVDTVETEADFGCSLFEELN